MPKFEPWFLFVESVLRPPVSFWFNWRFEGMENIPLDGPVLVACNHISYLDPLAHGLMLVKGGRHPRYLAKSELYRNGFMRLVLEGAGQIPVERGTGSAAPIEAASRALQEEQVVVVYPEGTVTRNADSTPMQGRTGVARLTLAAGVPVLPIAVWGAQFVWPRGGARDLRFGRPIWLKAGAPLDFSDFEGREDEPEVLRKITDAIMEELSRLVTDLRSRYPKRWR